MPCVRTNGRVVGSSKNERFGVVVGCVVAFGGRVVTLLALCVVIGMKVVVIGAEYGYSATMISVMADWNSRKIPTITTYQSQFGGYTGQSNTRCFRACNFDWERK